MSTQEFPAASHFCHWYVNTGFDPLHVPVEAVRVAATTGVPLIVGGVTFFGGAAVITGVELETPGAEPSGVAAVTRTRTLLPTSPEVRV